MILTNRCFCFQAPKLLRIFLASTDVIRTKGGHLEEGRGMKSRREINQEGRKGNVATKNVSVSEVEQSGGRLQS